MAFAKGMRQETAVERRFKKGMGNSSILKGRRWAELRFEGF
jgi:hypothetical protein